MEPRHATLLTFVLHRHNAAVKHHICGGRVRPQRWRCARDRASHHVAHTAQPRPASLSAVKFFTAITSRRRTGARLRARATSRRSTERGLPLPSAPPTALRQRCLVPSRRRTSTTTTTVVVGHTRGNERVFLQLLAGDNIIDSVLEALSRGARDTVVDQSLTHNCMLFSALDLRVITLPPEPRNFSSVERVIQL